MESGTSAAVTAVNGMISTIATDAMSVWTTALPVIAPVMAVGILVSLGYGIARRFLRK